MGFISGTKKVAGRIVDIRVDKWMGWDYIGETTDRFKSILVDMVVPKKATVTETFDEAMERLDLTEADIAQRKFEFTRLFYFFVALSMLIIMYALYVAIKGSMTPALIAFCLALYCLTQAFRFHFWLFQIKNRKLGCSMKEWFNAKIMHDEPNTTLMTTQTAPPKVKKKKKHPKAD